MAQPLEPAPTIVGELAAPSPRARRRSSEATERALLDSIGGLEVVRRLGAGAIGAVWLAHDPVLDRDVAIKLVLPGRHTRERARARILREAQALARLRHPNVVAIHEVGTTALASEEDAPQIEQMYLVMEYVDGPTLRKWAKLEPRSIPELLEVAVAAGRGLAAAHAAGLVHGDFKPDNVLVGVEGRVKVVDFGLAFAAEPGPRSGAIRVGDRRAEDSSPLLRAGLDHAGAAPVRGTPAYMSPEQLIGAASDAGSDQFSFCVSLWELVHGQRPWPHDSLDKLRAAARKGELEPSASNRQLPRWLDAALRRGLAQAPEQRFETMSALVEELELRPRMIRRRQRRTLLAGASVVIVAASWQVATRQAHLDSRVEQPRACINAVERIHETWSDERGARLHAAFVAAGDERGRAYTDNQWTRVSALLERTRDAWLEQRLEVCELQRDPSQDDPAKLDARASCLEQQRGSLDATLTVLERADAATIEHALDIVSATIDLETCRDPHPVYTPPPTAHDELVELAALRAELARAEAEYRSDHPERATEILDDIAERVAALDYAPLLGEWQLTRGRAAMSVDDHETAERYIRVGLASAELCVDDQATLGAWADLLYLAAVNHRDEEARWIVARAEVVLQRLGQARERVDPLLRAHWLNAKAVSYALRGEYEPSFPLFEAAVAALDELPEGTPNSRDPLTNLATIYLRAGRAADAEATYLRSIERIEHSWGEHPKLALPWLGLGNVYSERDLSAAREAYERALGLWYLAAEGHRPRIAVAHTNLALVALSAGDWARAREHASSALELQREIYPDDHERLISTELTLARTRLEAKDRDAAAELLASIDERVTAVPEHAMRGALLLGLAELALVDGEPERAARSTSEGLAALGAFERDDPSITQRAQLVLARAALAQGQPALAEQHATEGLGDHREPQPGVGLELPRLRLVLAEARWAQAVALERDLARACTEPEPAPACALGSAARDSAADARVELQALDPSPGRVHALETVDEWLAAHALEPD